MDKRLLYQVKEMWTIWWEAIRTYAFGVLVQFWYYLHKKMLKKMVNQNTECTWSHRIKSTFYLWLSFVRRELENSYYFRFIDEGKVVEISTGANSLIPEYRCMERGTL